MDIPIHTTYFLPKNDRKERRINKYGTRCHIYSNVFDILDKITKDICDKLKHSGEIVALTYIQHTLYEEKEFIDDIKNDLLRSGASNILEFQSRKALCNYKSDLIEGRTCSSDKMHTQHIFYTKSGTNESTYTMAVPVIRFGREDRVVSHRKNLFNPSSRTTMKEYNDGGRSSSVDKKSSNFFKKNKFYKPKGKDKTMIIPAFVLYLQRGRDDVEQRLYPTKEFIEMINFYYYDLEMDKTVTKPTVNNNNNKRKFIDLR